MSLDTDNKHLDMTCPYCKQLIGASESAVICTDCGIALHRNCWDSNQGCTTFGCYKPAPVSKVVHSCIAHQPNAQDVTIPSVTDSEQLQETPAQDIPDKPEENTCEATVVLGKQVPDALGETVPEVTAPIVGPEPVTPIMFELDVLAPEAVSEIITTDAPVGPEGFEEETISSPCEESEHLQPNAPATDNSVVIPPNCRAKSNRSMLVGITILIMISVSSYYYLTRQSQVTNDGAVTVCVSETPKTKVKADPDPSVKGRYLFQTGNYVGALEVFAKLWKQDQNKYEYPEMAAKCEVRLAIQAKQSTDNKGIKAHAKSADVWLLRAAVAKSRPSDAANRISGLRATIRGLANISQPKPPVDRLRKLASIRVCVATGLLPGSYCKIGTRTVDRSSQPSKKCIRCKPLMVWICARSHKQPRPWCKRIMVKFRPGTVPTQRCELCKTTAGHQGSTTNTTSARVDEHHL